MAAGFVLLGDNHERDQDVLRGHRRRILAVCAGVLSVGLLVVLFGIASGAVSLVQDPAIAMAGQYVQPGFAGAVRPLQALKAPWAFAQPARASHLLASSAAVPSPGASDVVAATADDTVVPAGEVAASSDGSDVRIGHPFPWSPAKAPQFAKHHSSRVGGALGQVATSYAAAVGKPAAPLIYDMPTAAPACPLVLEAELAQAAQAVREAMDAGVTRMQMELELPTPDGNEGYTWPGGVPEQEQVLKPMLMTLLSGALGVSDLSLDEEGEDEEGLHVFSVSTGAKPITVVLLPEQAQLKELRGIKKAVGKGVLLVVNPQWRNHEEPFGPWKVLGEELPEEFMKDFQEVYFLRRFNVKGEEMQVLQVFPSPSWYVFRIEKDKAPTTSSEASLPRDGTAPVLLWTAPKQPTYWELDKYRTFPSRGLAWSKEKF